MYIQCTSLLPHSFPCIVCQNCACDDLTKSDVAFLETFRNAWTKETRDETDLTE